MIDDVLKTVDLAKLHRADRGISGLSLTISPGESCAIVGPNGSGKTTSIHTLVGIHTPTSGRGWIAGHPLGSVPAKAATGFMPDDLSLPPFLTGLEYLRFVQGVSPSGSVKVAQELAVMLGLGEDLDQVIAKYSHGMKRKLQVAAAMAPRPHLLILDEPYRGMDPEATVLLRSLLSQARTGGAAVLVATHDMQLAATFDRVVVLAKSRQIATLEPSEWTGKDRGEELESRLWEETGLDKQIMEKLNRLKELA